MFQRVIRKILDLVKDSRDLVKDAGKRENKNFRFIVFFKNLKLALIFHVSIYIVCITAFFSFFTYRIFNSGLYRQEIMVYR
jgi:hypothetical protein